MIYDNNSVWYGNFMSRNNVCANASPADRTLTLIRCLSTCSYILVSFVELFFLMLCILLSFLSCELPSLCYPRLSSVLNHDLLPEHI